MEPKVYIRLNKFLSDAGVCSRREADRLVEAGRVRIGGRAAVLGEKVSGEEEILVDGTPVKGGSRKVILAYHKPAGIVCSSKNQGKEKNNIVDAVHYPVRIYPVGRLDKDSEGLIFLTNDGEIVNKIMRAGNFHEKEYRVRINAPVTDSFLKGMGSGVRIPSGMTRPCRIWRTGETEFHIILTQGMNRQIRYMCEAFSYQVISLKRIRIMNVELGNLKKGEYRELTDAEQRELQKLCEGSKN
ncbi:pseudouridine synthase [bacterium C-53]|nr:pseudouridine synthase [Lachnospiraceae bacterium]NBI04338.1 pseudouridine synthase [Lachnospiraceae bacterium]RKJ08338.1 pseudouridine synthase [bacterium C-53]